jgi:hypothetical protein
VTFNWTAGDWFDVFGIVDWTCSAPERQQTSVGSEQFTFGMHREQTGGFTIIKENGQIIKLAPTNNQKNPSTLTSRSDGRSLVDTLSAYLFGVGGTARHSRHKRSKLVAPTTSHTTQSMSRPPADISNR